MVRHWRGPRRKLSPEEVEANARARAKHAADAMSCQICERKILANTGLIAHHGYQRPGHGWQTASCFGARYRPYEVACDALPKAIDSLLRWIAEKDRVLSTWHTSPPKGIRTGKEDTYPTLRHRWPSNPPRTYLRPAGFNPNAKVNPYAGEGAKYARLYHAEIADMESQIRHATADMLRLRKRLADWKPQEDLDQ